MCTKSGETDPDPLICTTRADPDPFMCTKSGETDPDPLICTTRADPDPFMCTKSDKTLRAQRAKILDLSTVYREETDPFARAAREIF